MDPKNTRTWGVIPQNKEIQNLFEANLCLTPEENKFCIWADYRDVFITILIFLTLSELTYCFFLIDLLPDFVNE